MTTPNDQPGFVPSSDQEELTLARNQVLVAHANLLGVMERQRLLGATQTDAINQSLANGGAFGIESFINAHVHGVVNATVVSATGARLVIATVQDMQRRDMN